MPDPTPHQLATAGRLLPATSPDLAGAVAALAEASGDPAAFHLVYSTLMRLYDDSCRLGHMTQFADEVAAIAVQVLRDAGRLRPAGGKTRTEHGVRLTWGDGESQDFKCDSRADAEAMHDHHVRCRREDPNWLVASSLVQRKVGSWVGPWQPVPAEAADAAAVGGGAL